MKRSTIVLLLILGTILPLFPVEAQTGDLWVNLEVENVYGLRGETIKITSNTNYGFSSVRIFDPQDVMIYSQTWPANDTRQIPISQTADYGTYRIVGRVPSVKTETWFTVLDITGWNPVTTWPHVVNHGGLEYNFYKNWTIGVRLYEDTLNIDLSTIRKLSKAYDMDVSPKSNDMNFLVRFTKGANTIDLNFAFIHTGAKLIINGSLDHARDISIEFDARNRRVKKRLSGISAGNIVFDWSDVLGGEWWTYLPEEKELMIHAPETFRIDPTIFSDGFDSGDFTEWTSQTGSPTVVSNVSHHGGYSMMVKGDNVGSADYATKDVDFSGVNPRFLSFNIYFEDLGDTDYTGRLGGINYYGSYLGGLTLNHNGSANGFRVIYSDTTGKYGATSILQGTWYHVEIEQYGGTGDAYVAIYLDGVLEINQTGLTETTVPNRISVGNQGDYKGAETYHDCVETSSTYMGPEPTGTLIDSYSESNQDQYTRCEDLHPSDEFLNSAFSQTFTPNASYTLTSSVWYMDVWAGSPTGYAHSEVYAESGGLPTGSALATSEDFDVSLLPASPELYTFTFTGEDQITLSNGVTYVITCIAPTSGTIDASNSFTVLADGSSPTHPGTMGRYQNGAWSTQSGDMCFYVYGNLIGGANNAPVNDQMSITDMSDTDNIYAEYANYTIDYDGHDADGYADIDEVLLNITQGATVRASFKYDEDTNTFSIFDGDDKFEIETDLCSATRTGNNLNLTVRFRAEWDATAEDDCELKAYIVDDEPESDTDTLQTDYCDIVTDLVTTFSFNDDRGNLEQSITASGAITYTGSSLYPADDQFTSISVYDSLDNNEGTNTTIVNGVWEITFTAPATVGIDTYNLYIDGVGDYPDGEETSPTETFITDQIVVYWETLDDERVNINANIEGRYRAVLDYDETPLGDGDSLSVGWGALSWDAGNSWFDISHTESTVGAVTISGWTGTEATYTITSITENVTETSYIYDRIMVYWETLDDSRVSVNANIEGRYRAVLDYDETDLGSGDSLSVGWGALSWDAGNSWFEISHTESTVGAVTISGWTGTEATYTITSITENVTEASYIYDRQQLQTLDGNNTTPDPSQPFKTWLTAESEYDAHVLTTGDSITLEDDSGNPYVYAWNGTMFVNVTSHSINGTYIINTYSSVNEVTYGITVLHMGGLSLTITVGTVPPPSTITVDVRVITSAGAGIQAANVEFDNGTLIVDEDTNTTGYIAQQDVLPDNYTFTIVKDGYIPYNHTYSISTNIYWVIRLFTVEEGALVTTTVTFTLELLVLAGISSIFTLIMIYSRTLTLGFISGILAFFFWWGTALNYMYEHASDTLSLGYLFIGLAWICLIFAIYYTAKTLDPKARPDIAEEYD